MSKHHHHKKCQSCNKHRPHYHRHCHHHHHKHHDHHHHKRHCYHHKRYYRHHIVCPECPPIPPTPPTAPSLLGSAVNFRVLAHETITNTGPTIINGDLGLSPGTSVTGFPPGIVVGTQHITDAAAAQAQVDLTTAWNAITAIPATTDLTGLDLGTLTLLPGVYNYDTSAQLTGNLILDAAGDASAVWMFKIGSTLTTANASSVTIINGGQADNVYWQVGSSATLGTTTAFVGNILAQDSITVTTGATISGRALARTAAVTLDTNIIAP